MRRDLRVCIQRHIHRTVGRQTFDRPSELLNLRGRLFDRPVPVDFQIHTRGCRTRVIPEHALGIRLGHDVENGGEADLRREPRRIQQLLHEPFDVPRCREGASPVWTRAYIQNLCLPLSGTDGSVTIGMWMGRPCPLYPVTSPVAYGKRATALYRRHDVGMYRGRNTRYRPYRVRKTYAPLAV